MHVWKYTKLKENASWKRKIDKIQVWKYTKLKENASWNAKLTNACLKIYKTKRKCNLKTQNWQNTNLKMQNQENASLQIMNLK